MKNILVLEDDIPGREALLRLRRHMSNCEFDFVFVETVTGLDELLCGLTSYTDYAAIILCLRIDMPLFTRADIVRRIPALDQPNIPTMLCGHIPLYGLDYFLKVIVPDPAAQTSIQEGRIILISDHSKSQIDGLKPLYDKSRFPTVPFFDRADKNATFDLWRHLCSL